MVYPATTRRTLNSGVRMESGSTLTKEQQTRSAMRRRAADRGLKALEVEGRGLPQFFRHVVEYLRDSRAPAPLGRGSAPRSRERTDCAVPFAEDRLKERLHLTVSQEGGEVALEL
jgi:hypothetical protein